MVRQISIICLLIVIIIGSLFGINYLKNTTNNMIDTLSQLEAYVKDNNIDEAIETCKKLESDWQQYIVKLAIFIRDDMLHSIHSMISPLKTLAENREYSLLMYEIEKIKTILTDLYTSELFRIDNIL